MVANSDFQIWQQTVNGINESGKTELTQEEWLALTVLNGSLSNGDFSSDESRRSINSIKDNLNRHSNNPVLQIHLQNFIALCNKYGMIHQGTKIAQPLPKPTPISTPSTRQTNTIGQTKKSGINFMQVIIITAILLGSGYYFVKDSDWFNNLFSSEQKKTEQVEKTKVNSTVTETQAAIEKSEIEVEQANVQPSVQQSQNSNSAMPGRFPQASERLLTVSDLQNLSKDDLKIMRNEIFARHGYIFQTQDMKTYFQNQSWYSPQSSNVTAKLSNIEIKNVELIKSYENNATGSVSTKGAPPIENTNGYANASVLLPKDWDGKSILANGFVWIWENDTKLQKKYGIYPNGNNFLDDHETWDNDDTFYKYSLSPNVVIEAGGYDSSGSWKKTRRMNVNEFANYMHGLGYGVEKEGNAYGIVANVTYNNGMITKISERYTP